MSNEKWKKIALHIIIKSLYCIPLSELNFQRKKNPVILGNGVQIITELLMGL